MTHKVLLPRPHTNISAEIIIKCIVPTSTRVINLSLQTAVFPSEMKCAVVTPLLKKASLGKGELKNYRPVSNLSFISKITEKVTLSQISEHLDKNNLWSPLQSVYRKGHSTETALLRIQNDILRSLDKSRGVLLVLLDLSAAFDTIDHEILAFRLQQRIGITGSALMWIKSYLSHRQQTIDVSGESSSVRELMYGIPHGICIGP